MEKEKTNSSTFSIPSIMSDVTLISTPLPQATSTATKRSMIDQDLPMSNIDKSRQETQPADDCDKKNGLKDVRHLESTYKNLSDLQDKVSKELAELRRMSNLKHNYGDKTEFGSSQLSSWPTHGDLVVSEGLVDNNKLDVNNFEFRKPSVPVKSYKNNGPNVGKKSKTDVKHPRKSTSKNNFKSSSYEINENLPVRDNSAKLPETSSFVLSNFGNQREDRISITSSLNSSLGIISPEILEEAQQQPLLDINHDLSQRLAEHLNLDTSQLKDGLDISTLATVRLKAAVVARREEDKENQRSSSRSSSNNWALYGYSSDSSDSRNNTAKEIARLSDLSSASGGGTELSYRPISSPGRARPLSERNSSFLRKSTSKSGRLSVTSNSFLDSKMSVCSEDFQSGKDAMERLNRDEEQFSLAERRSLSGIYGEGDISISTKGEKLSISSFLRSGSGPLGCLEKTDNDAQRPQFGMLANSPEKKGKPRAIMPPPQDKSTFIVEEVPVRDTPWAPHSLAEQFSLIHDGDVRDSDVSVPSLSYISDMLKNLDEGASPVDILDQLMAFSKNKPTNTSQHMVRISSVVEGEKSFCHGVEAERSKLHHEVLNESAATSIADVTDFEGDEEACVCVMTPESMDFDIYNELSQPMQYSFSKSCYVDGKRQDSAAFIHLPDTMIVLYPGQRKTLSITIAALIGGVIKIKIEVVRTNPVTKEREYSNVYGKIVAELPKILRMTPQNCELTPTPDAESYGTYRHVMELKNNGLSVVPLKLQLTQVNYCDNYGQEIMFHFGDKKQKAVTLMLEPGQTVKQLIQCDTPPVFEALKSTKVSGIIPVEARVDFLLATTELYKLSPLSPISLLAPLKSNFFGAPSKLVIPSDGTASLPLFNSSGHPVDFKTNIHFGFSVKPATFTVQPNQKLLLTVSMDVKKNPNRQGELTLHSFNPHGMHIIRLQGAYTSYSCNSSLATPQSSRAPSPTSPRSSLGASVGELMLACSSKELVFGACALYQRVTKVCCLKNRSQQREKLRLKITDQHQCFKIVCDKDRLESEVKFSLQPMENREITVAVVATGAGPQWGHLTISRISSPAHSKVLRLYAFGGRSKVNIEGVVEIPPQLMFVNLDEDALSSSFSLRNAGNHTAFFRISEASMTSTTGLAFSPPEAVLPVGHSVSVEISLSITLQLLEYLLRQTTPTICVAQLSVCYGDESTRLRLLKMQGVDAKLSQRIALLSQISPYPIDDLDKLDDPASYAETLWQEDISEWKVGVFVKRTALEALRLDTTVNLMDLTTTGNQYY